VYLAVAATTAIIIWELTSAWGGHTEIVAWSVAGLCCCVAVPLPLHDIFLHMVHYANPSASKSTTSASFGWSQYATQRWDRRGINPPTAAGLQLHLLARHYNAAGLPCDFMIIVRTLPFFEASTGMPKLCLNCTATFSHDVTCPDLYEAFVLWSFYKCMVDSFVSSRCTFAQASRKGPSKDARTLLLLPSKA